MLGSRTSSRPMPRGPVTSVTILAPRGERNGGVRIRNASPRDGLDVAALVRRCPGLDANSAYAYVLLCDEFRDTCITARGDDGRLTGFVTGFLSPRDPSRAFLWQVGVDPDHRGRGLAHALVRAFAQSARAAGAVSLETTIAPDNAASLALFSSFAASVGSSLRRISSYPGEWLGEDHPDEDRYEIDLARCAG